MTEVVNGTNAMDHAKGEAIPTRTNSYLSQSQTLTPSRGGTLKKKSSVRRIGSLSRNNSTRRSSYAGSVRSLSRGGAATDEPDLHSAFYTPVPTRGSPTELLADRFQEWRKVLKDLITYFKEAQKSHESKVKSLDTLSRIVANAPQPTAFMSEGGIADATALLRQYHKQALAEAGKARQVEEDIVVQLTGLRSDLGQKIKEIKNLSGDFKNGVDKEQEKTREAVRNLQEALKMEESRPDTATGKADPFLVRLAVERQLERQIDEENYLHQAFLNLEHSGLELESIVVGEIQKAYNAYAGIMKREADEQYEVVEALRNGPLAIPKAREWEYFLDGNENFVDPKMPMRKPETIHYPGKDSPAAAEVRSGMLERKSKYLKSYTPGWYVLSPTHLHEFKSPDRLGSQQPVMSLHLSEQRLGSHSTLDSSSHKFMLKGKQSGAGMHRGHGWQFRAESHETMMAWYDDIKQLTEKTGEERNAYVRRHARSLSGTGQPNDGTRSGPGSVSSDGDIEQDDEADAVPYSATNSVQNSMHKDVHATIGSAGAGAVGVRTASRSPAPAALGVGDGGGAATAAQTRPVPGGRFPSEIDVSRHLQTPRERFDPASSEDDEHAFVAVRPPPPQQLQHQHLVQQHQTEHVRDPAEITALPVVGAGGGAGAVVVNPAHDAAAEIGPTAATSEARGRAPARPQAHTMMSGALAEPRSKEVNAISRESSMGGAIQTRQDS